MRLIQTIIIATTLALAGCAGWKGAGCSAEPEARALWVTRWDYTTPADVAHIIANADALNFNVILFQVRGNGTVFYPSAIEPWAWELTSDGPATTGQDPGWDPLRMAIDLAHERGIELHAYMNVFPAWRTQTYPPREAAQLWWEHPDWFMADAAGNRMIPRDTSVPYSDDVYGGPLANIGEREAPPGDWYAFINPAHPEVQDYLTALFTEVAANYPDLDGIHYDYIRYPVEIREVREGYEDTVETMGNWSYDPVSLRRFTEDTGIADPHDNPEAWTAWRAQQITDIVQRVHDSATEVNPDIVFSASVMANPEDAFQTKHQDYITWMNEGWLDMAVTMGYTSDHAMFQERLQMVKQTMSDQGTYIAGLTLGGDPQNSVTQIGITREEGLPGFAGFAYSHLFDRDNQHVWQEKAHVLLAGPLAECAPLPW